MKRHTIALALVLAAGSLTACAEYTTTGLPADETAATSEQTGEAPAADPVAGQPSAAEAVAETVVGMTAKDAEAAVVAAGLTYRVISEDGEPLAATADYRADRVNVDIVDGTVTAATVG